MLLNLKPPYHFEITNKNDKIIVKGKTLYRGKIVDNTGVATSSMDIFVESNPRITGEPYGIDNCNIVYFNGQITGTRKSPRPNIRPNPIPLRGINVTRPGVPVNARFSRRIISNPLYGKPVGKNTLPPQPYINPFHTPPQNAEPIVLPKLHISPLHVPEENEANHVDTINTRNLLRRAANAHVRKETFVDPRVRAAEPGKSSIQPKMTKKEIIHNAIKIILQNVLKIGTGFIYDIAVVDALTNITENDAKILKGILTDGSKNVEQYGITNPLGFNKLNKDQMAQFRRLIPITGRVMLKRVFPVSGGRRTRRKNLTKFRRTRK